MSFAEFADPPPVVNSSMGTQNVDLITLKEDIVPIENPPKTLVDWAVLILNTSHPQLKVPGVLTVVPSRSTKLHTASFRLSGHDMLLIYSDLGN